MSTLIPVLSGADIPEQYRGTPVSELLEYHNLGRAFEKLTQARLLVGMCMDHRKHLRIPDNFAYIIRAGGANLRHSEFKVSYAIGVGGVRAIALIGHDQCGMSGLVQRKDEFIRGLVDGAGWETAKAEEHFHQFAPLFEIGNEADFVLSEARRLRDRYPRMLIAPMMYSVDDTTLSIVREE